jgi:ureidoglycolate dehydrogenase (NAD+)
MALHVPAFDSLEAFTHRVDELARRIRALPPAEGAPRAFLPGEPEHLRAQEHQARGIPLPSDSVAEIERAGRLLGIVAPRPL